MKYRLAMFSAPLVLALAAGQSGPLRPQELPEDFVGSHYSKAEYRIPMRDGTKLFTSVYSPRDTTRKWPILIKRTPYSVSPYGEGHFPSFLGPSPAFTREKFIFAYQDVRGCFQSEGEFVNVRPHLPRKNTSNDIDESTDTFDTVAWLLDNVKNHNRRVGIYGISYPGFYASAGMIDSHPALVASSPQAPIADWFFDDFHHHGAFFLAHAFNFLASFGLPREGLTTQHNPRFEHGTPDGYRFFLDMGSLRNAETLHLKGRVRFWNELAQHPNYDDFWKARNLLPHLKRVSPAVMTVGGWFDAEDLYGPLQTYRAIEAANPGVSNTIVMGPWSHGAWALSSGSSLGDIHFGSNTAEFYREQIELPFFIRQLKQVAQPEPPEAFMFETGSNQWRRFGSWPPPEIKAVDFFCLGGGLLAAAMPREGGAIWDAYTSDPAKPVPFSEDIGPGMNIEYMTADQRFAARRTDVLTYRTAPLEHDLTVAGPVVATLWVSTTGTAADWVVKLIDVFPPDAEDFPNMSRDTRLGGYQMMVRSEVMRGRFRNGYEHPEPFVPDEPSLVQLPLQDVLHTFGKGHRIMVQVQSSWFPLVDRNPQKWVENIFQAEEGDFIVATHRLFRSRDFPSGIRVGVLPEAHAGAEAVRK